MGAGLASGGEGDGVHGARVNEVVDGGSVIRQSRVEVGPGESAEELHQRIQEVEHRLLPEVVGDLAAGKIPWGKDPRT